MEHTSFIDARRIAAEEFDRAQMKGALVASGGIVLRAAVLLGISENFYWKRAKAIGLDIPGIRAEVGHPKGRYDVAAPNASAA
jgi:hypothetical protein